MSAMRRVIERLQTENTSLKSRAKVNGVKSTTLTALEKENKKLKVSSCCMYRLRMVTGHMTIDVLYVSMNLLP